MEKQEQAQKKNFPLQQLLIRTLPRRAYSHAQELCRQIGETPQLFPVLLGLGACYWARGKLQTARRLAEQLLQLAQRAHDSTLLLHAHMPLANIHLFLGELTRAHAHAEQGITLYESQRHNAQHTLYQGFDLGALCLSRAAQALWLLGYPTQALQRSRAALALAQELPHPQDLIWAIEDNAILHQLRRDEQLTHEQAAIVIALSTEQGSALSLADATILQGWLLAEQEQGEEGVARIYQGLAVFRAIGSASGLTYCLALLAEACGKAGRIAEGLRALDEALRLVDKNSERVYEAELWRLKGELLLQSKVESGKWKVKSRKKKACPEFSRRVKNDDKSSVGIRRQSGKARER